MQADSKYLYHDRIYLLSYFFHDLYHRILILSKQLTDWLNLENEFSSEGFQEALRQKAYLNWIFCTNANLDKNIHLAHVDHMRPFYSLFST